MKRHGMNILGDAWCIIYQVVHSILGVFGIWFELSLALALILDLCTLNHLDSTKTSYSLRKDLNVLSLFWEFRAGVWSLVPVGHRRPGAKGCGRPGATPLWTLRGTLTALLLQKCSTRMLSNCSTRMLCKSIMQVCHMNVFCNSVQEIFWRGFLLLHFFWHFFGSLSPSQAQAILEHGSDQQRWSKHVATLELLCQRLCKKTWFHNIHLMSSLSLFLSVASTIVWRNYLPVLMVSAWGSHSKCAKSASCQVDLSCRPTPES